jgi:hypothetical protein
MLMVQLVKVNLLSSSTLACLLLLPVLACSLLLLLLLLPMRRLNGWWWQCHQAIQLQLLPPLLLLLLCGLQARRDLVPSTAERRECPLARPLRYTCVPVLCTEQLFRGLSHRLCPPVASGSSSSCSSSGLNGARAPGPA